MKKDVLIMALYLPQFYVTPENDEWWGKNFTDWIAVKRATSFYGNHNIPRVPLDNNYYNLLSKDTMMWQAGLMKKHCIDAMCMYHYWFADGRKILEKPAENLLEWKDIEMPFCFCWANETWSRTWKNIKEANNWASKFETNSNTTNGVLLQQRYGREQDWEEHFQYLLPFFKDERYIKENNEPVFVIYKNSIIYCFHEMMSYFNKRAKDYGFHGIHVIGMYNSRDNQLNGFCMRQPAWAQVDVKPIEEHDGLKVYSYDDLWRTAINQCDMNPMAIPCAFVDYDTTPRMGKLGWSVVGAEPSKFEKYFSEMYAYCVSRNQNYLFINAWNEWGESMYLEPDEKFGYGYLNAIRKVVTQYKEKGILAKVTVDSQRMIISQSRDLVILDLLELANKNIRLAEFFERYNYRAIAIYGMGNLGKYIATALVGDAIKVVVGIDKKLAGSKIENVEVISPNDDMPDVDAAIVTLINYNSEVIELLKSKGIKNVVVITEVIDELKALHNE